MVKRDQWNSEGCGHLFRCTWPRSLLSLVKTHAQSFVCVFFISRTSHIPPPLQVPIRFGVPGAYGTAQNLRGVCTARDHGGGGGAENRATGGFLYLCVNETIKRETGFVTRIHASTPSSVYFLGPAERHKRDHHGLRTNRDWQDVHCEQSRVRPQCKQNRHLARDPAGTLRMWFGNRRACLTCDVGLCWCRGTGDDTERGLLPRALEHILSWAAVTNEQSPGAAVVELSYVQVRVWWCPQSLPHFRRLLRYDVTPFIAGRAQTSQRAVSEFVVWTYPQPPVATGRAGCFLSSVRTHLSVRRSTWTLSWTSSRVLQSPKWTSRRTQSQARESASGNLHPEGAASSSGAPLASGCQVGPRGERGPNT